MGTSYYGTGAGELTADPALKGVTKSFGGGEAYNFNSGNRSVAFPVGALLGAGAQAFSGLMEGRALRNQTNMEYELGKAQLGFAERAGLQNLLAGQYALTGAKQYDMGLQRDAANYQQAFLDPRKSILNVEDFNRRAAGELNPFAQKLRQQEKAGDINTLLAGKFMPMFESANKPFSYGRAPGYTTGSLV